MSHFTVLVIGNDFEGQLEPYDEQIEAPEYCSGDVSEENKQRMIEYYNRKGKTKAKTFDFVYKKFGEEWDAGRCRKDKDGVWREYTTYNPKSKWDWYQVGGRWTGFFKMKSDTEGKTGEPGIMTDPAEEGFADAVIVGDVDFDSMRAEARKSAEEHYDKVMAVIGDLPINKTWEEMIEGVTDKDKLDKARDDYWAQERCVALKKAEIGGWNISPDDYMMTREEYTQQAEDNVGVPYAFVKDGKWYQKGEMGWWGMSSDEMTQAEWNAKVQELYNELPKETMLTLVDCHI